MFSPKKQGVITVLPISKEECREIRIRIPQAYIVCINAGKKSRAKKYAVEETKKVLDLLEEMRDGGRKI